MNCIPEVEVPHVAPHAVGAAVALAADVADEPPLAGLDVLPHQVVQGWVNSSDVESPYLQWICNYMYNLSCAVHFSGIAKVNFVLA